METLFEKFGGKNVKIKPFRELYKKVHFGLWINGVYPDQRSVKHKIWRSINIFTQLSGIYVLGYATLKDIAMKDYSDATRQLSIMTLMIIMVFKLFSLSFNQERIQSLIDRMDRFYAKIKRSESKEEIEFVRKSIQHSIVVQNVWGFQIAFVGGVFSFSAIGIMLYLTLSDSPFERKMIFYTIFPYVDHLKYKTPFYELGVAYEFFINFFVTILYVSYDPLIPIFILFVCGQFDVIKYRIGNIINEKENMSEEVIRQKLIDAIENLQDLYNFTDDVNKASRYVSQFVFLVSPVLSTVSGFQIYNMLKNGEVPYEFLFFVGATFFHIFMPSYYGDLLQEKSLSVGDALYKSGWEECPHIPTRKTILLMIVRSQKPVVLKTFFSTISLHLFAEVCQTTWAMFNLLAVAFDTD